jgi:hypothetical protein
MLFVVKCLVKINLKLIQFNNYIKLRVKRLVRNDKGNKTSIVQYSREKKIF